MHGSRCPELYQWIDTVVMRFLSRRKPLALECWHNNSWQYGMFAGLKISHPNQTVRYAKEIYSNYL
jgi:hypothetical protein